MESNVAYVQLSGVSSKATLGLYAGMEPHELQLLAQVALKHHGDVCAGFQVAPDASTSQLSRRTRTPSAIPRLVPLSVACKAPELLQGNASALFVPSTSALSGREAPKDVSTTGTVNEMLEKLLRALQSEQNMRSFEFTMLKHLCEQRKAHVLNVMSGDLSVDEKKQFLLQMLRPPMAEERKSSVMEPQHVEFFHAELIAKEVASIGKKHCGPRSLPQILAYADKVRQNRRRKYTFADTIEMLSIAGQLLADQRLSETAGVHLVKLIVEENNVLWSALNSYRNGEITVLDLETTAKQLAVVESEAFPALAKKKRKEKSPRKSKLGSSPSKKSMRTTASQTVALSATSVLLQSLHTQTMLTSLELEILMALVEQEDGQVLEILEAFEQSEDRDETVLRDALVSVVEEITMELGDEEKAATAVAFARGGVDHTTREEPHGVESGEESEMVGWQRHLSFLLDEWQAQEQLTVTGASTLRRMVTQRHNLLESAYEVFAGDGDASELLDTLQRVAKLQQQIEQCQAGKTNDRTDAAVFDGLSLDEVVREMQRRGVVQANDAAGLLALFYGGNEALQAANEAYEADGDVNELEETLLLVVKHARFGQEDDEKKPVNETQAVCRLLAVFGRTGRLELWQIQLLISLVKCQDPRLLAAVDVYQEEENTDELVDTLEVLVELVAWERHHPLMIKEWIAPLVRSGNVGRDGAERLVQLVKARDDRIVAALVVFLSDNNKVEFMDTLGRIARLEGLKVSDARKYKVSEGYVGLVWDQLKGKATISEQERTQMEKVIGSGEPRMLAAMDVFVATQDVEEFVDTARRIVLKVKEKEKEKEKIGLKGGTDMVHALDKEGDKKEVVQNGEEKKAENWIESGEGGVHTEDQGETETFKDGKNTKKNEKEEKERKRDEKVKQVEENE